jgi:hypothetical protein
VEKDQHDPHWPWSFTAVTADFSLQSMLPEIVILRELGAAWVTRVLLPRGQAEKFKEWRILNSCRLKSAKLFSPKYARGFRRRSSAALHIRLKNVKFQRVVMVRITSVECLNHAHRFSSAFSLIE